MRKLVFITLAAVLVSCNTIKKKAKETINVGGETVGKGASEFFEGVAEGVDKTSDGLVSINDILSSKSFRIYPNPTKDWIHISVDSKNIGINYTITSVTGEKLYEGKIENLDTAINIQDLAEGIYFIQLGSDTLRSFKLLKQ